MRRGALYGASFSRHHSSNSFSVAWAPLRSSTAAAGISPLSLCGKPEGRCAGHGRMGGDGLFQFACVHRIAAGLDDVFHPANRPYRARRLRYSQVARAQPAIFP